MKFSQPVEVLVRARSSRRSFEATHLAADQRARLLEEMRLMCAAHGVFGSALRFELLAATEDDATALRGLHTYGFIKNPAAFLVGTVGPGLRNLEDFGIALEMLVLKATELGLGSCWLGGTFNRSRFARRIALGSEETMPAVIALGNATESQGAVERLIRWGAGAKKRKPWGEKFFDVRYGAALVEDRTAWWHAPLEMARLAPSASNKQPVAVVRDAEKFHFVLVRSPGYARNMRTMGLADLQRVDAGIAMCHFQLGAEAAGRRGEWRMDFVDLAGLPAEAELRATWVDLT